MFCTLVYEYSAHTLYTHTHIVCARFSKLFLGSIILISTYFRFETDTILFLTHSNLRTSAQARSLIFPLALLLSLSLLFAL